MRKTIGVVVAATILFGLSGAGHAATITLRFQAVADLSPFGGLPNSEIDGRVTWDPANPAHEFSESIGFAHHFLDGSPGSPTAAFAINSIEYGDRIRPSSSGGFGASRLVLFPGSMFLDLWFVPEIDLDGGPAPDIALVSLDLWTDSDPPVFRPGDFQFPPSDLSFLSRLEHRRLLLLGFERDEFGLVFPAEPVVQADQLRVIPEPASMTLLVLGLSAAAVSRAKRVRYRR
jgi:hypothetical protein